MIYIVITNSYDKINTWSPENASGIYKKIKVIASLKVKNMPGITNKCIFKHMDLLDELDN